jgi:catechol-2,3-dioxygenase
MKIQELKLYTSRHKKQAAFYSNVLNLNILEQTEKSVSFQIGNSIVHFEKKMDATPYHFAINIPANKGEEALVWLKSRLSILKDGKDEIIDFTAWNAKAIYFYDEDKNILNSLLEKTSITKLTKVLAQTNFSKYRKLEYLPRILRVCTIH